MGLKDLYLKHVVKHTAWHVAAYWVLIVALSMSVNIVFPVLYPGGAQLDKLSDPSSEAQRLFDARNLARELYLSKDTALTTAFILQFETLDNTNVFTPENLQTICEVEKIVSDESPLSPACDVEAPNGLCVSQRSNLLPLGTSVSAVFYSYNSSDPTSFWENSFAGFPLPSFRNIPIGTTGFFPESCNLLEQANVEYVTGHLVGNNNTFARQLYGFFLGKRTIELGFSAETRSVLQIGSDSSFDRVLQRIESRLLNYFCLKEDFFRSVYRNKARRGNLEVIFVEESFGS